MIVALAPTFKATLLGDEIQRGRPAGPRFEHTVHLLMRGIVLGAARATVLYAHA
jgi:hypothetical protein